MQEMMVGNRLSLSMENDFCTYVRVWEDKEVNIKRRLLSSVISDF